MRRSQPLKRHWLVILALLGFVLSAVPGCDDSGDDPETDVEDVQVDEGVDTTEVEEEVDVEEDDYDPFQDSDGDGIVDAYEDLNGNGEVDEGETDPRQPDTDNDGLMDGIEDANQNGFYDVGESDPLNDDTDGDGLLDGAEDTNLNGIYEPEEGETDPLSTDSDGDGLSDVVELESELDLDPNDSDSDGDGLPDGLEDSNANGEFEMDLGETNPASSDTDEDDLADGCEDLNANGTVDEGETDPRNRDSDGDGLPDGDECEKLPPGVCPNFDNVGNCATNPTNADTDGDGLTDYTEVTSDYGGGISTDPRNPDTDNDGVPDGLEDFNQNGHYDPAQGELNPIDPMTDGMTEDGQRPQAQACINTDMPELLENFDADIRFAYNAELDAVELGLPSSTPTNMAAWSLDHPTLPLATFILSKRPASTADNALEQEQVDAATIGSSPVFPRSFTTWDGHNARLSQFVISQSGTTVSVRNSLLAQLSGLSQSNIEGLPSGGYSGGSFELSLLTVYRSNDQVVLVGAIYPMEGATNDQTLVRAISLTNGTGLASYNDHFATNAAGDPLKACNIFRVTELPIVDFLFIIDDTASMEPYQTQLVEATDEIFAAIQSSFVSARWTLASTEVGDDSGGYEGGENHCGLLSSPKGPGGNIWAPFTMEYQDDFQCRVRDPLGNQDCDIDMSDQPGYAEYGLLCSKWAIDYFQGRRGTLEPTHLQRARSELIVIVVTDECEATECESGSEMSSIDSAETLNFIGVNSWSQVNRDNAARAFIDFYNSTASSPPYGAATPFIIYNVESTTDNAVYYEFIDEDLTMFPNGASMNIEDRTQIPEFVQKIIRAATGLASEFEPVHVPITANMKVVVQRAFTTDSTELPHSLVNGFNYDPVAHSMVFFGDDRPQLLDSFALSYAYWVAAE